MAGAVLSAIVQIGKKSCLVLFRVVLSVVEVELRVGADGVSKDSVGVQLVSFLDVEKDRVGVRHRAIVVHNQLKGVNAKVFLEDARIVFEEGQIDPGIGEVDEIILDPLDKDKFLKHLKSFWSIWSKKRGQ